MYHYLNDEQGIKERRQAERTEDSKLLLEITKDYGVGGVISFLLTYLKICQIDDKMKNFRDELQDLYDKYN